MSVLRASGVLGSGLFGRREGELRLYDPLVKQTTHATHSFQEGRIAGVESGAEGAEISSGRPAERDGDSMCAGKLPLVKLIMLLFWKARRLLSE